MKVEQARMNLLRKARARPDQVRKVLDTARTLGWKAAVEKVRNRLETPTPLGYSASGVVEKVDNLNTRLRVGDRVACGGNESAFHAEYIAVPDMLTAKVPGNVSNEHAAYTTIASIALQAVRQTDPRLGERVLVLGQGLVGLLVTNLLAASGVRVMAADVEPSRRPYCEQLGAECVVMLKDQNLEDEVRSWTEGFGVDAVVLCTGTSSNTPTEQSVDALRDRGRLVILGNTKADLLWKDAYAKEIEVRYSRSYGPGRYDTAYEWGGTDYPIGYVRWTEQRNFESCLHLMATGLLQLDAITTRRVPFAQSLDVYRELLDAGGKEIGVVLQYAGGESAESKAEPEPSVRRVGHQQLSSLSQRFAERCLEDPVTRLDVIGAGNFARTMLLPHLKDQIQFGTVVNNTSLSGNHVKSKFGFDKATTDTSLLLKSDVSSKGKIQKPAVLIATRHHLHAPLVVQTLKANRHVFVEKPLCLTREELAEIDLVHKESEGTVLVGFNRRFAPVSAELKQILHGVPGPKTASIRVMPGKLEVEHWYANYQESGGRVLGEACHFLDFFCFLFESHPVRVLAQTTWPPSGRLPFPDSVTAQVEFADGSCGQLIYSAEGDPSWPKEQVTVYGAGLVAEIVNFQKLVVHRGRRIKNAASTSKGHAEEMAAWMEFLRAKAPHPLPYFHSRTSMLLTFAVLDSIQQGRSVHV